MPLPPVLEAAVDRVLASGATVSTRLTEFAKYVEAHKDDPVALQAMVDRITAGADALDATEAANPDPDPND